jgi:hypothetical protein
MEKLGGHSYSSVKPATDEERSGMFKDIFLTIPGKYAFLNRLLNLRRDDAWRSFAKQDALTFGIPRLFTGEKPEAG